jgi:hypothetical protein
MPKFVYVQVHGNEKPAKIEADKVEEKKIQSAHAGDFELIITSKGAQVAKFQGLVVDGWWIQEEGEMGVV